MFGFVINIARPRDFDPNASIQRISSAHSNHANYYPEAHRVAQGKILDF
jgi:hypothetical protein